VVILTTEVRAWARECGMVIGGAKVARGIHAHGLVVSPDLTVTVEGDLVSNPIVVWGRKGVRKLPILIW
jgi:hypothetical protein